MATDKHGNVTNFSAEHFQKLLLQQQSQMEAQMKLIESLTQCLNVQSNGAATRDTQAVSLDLLTNSITEFHYDADSESTFEAWFKRWEDMFQTDFSRQDDSWKVRLLLRKLGTNEHTRFLDHILPKEPKDITFNEAVATLKEIFGESTSLFSIRYQCLKIVKRDTDDYGALADMVNRECERFKLRCLTDDQFKCLIFVSALQSPRDAEIRTRLLANLDQDPDLTLKSLVGECKRLITLKHDTAMIEQSRPTIADTVHAVQKARKSGSNKSFNRKPNKPPTPCWSCGEWHFARYCPFKRHICDKCHKRGHKEDFCHQSRPRNVKQSYRRKNFRKPDAESLSVIATFHSHSRTRRRFITVLINGIPTRLQFDTASDITIISKNTWKHIKKPKMIDSNKIAHNASGGVLKLVGEINCKIAFNGVEKAGTCYLSDRPNLNLLGLDWMEKLQLFDAPMSQICNTVQTDPVHSSLSIEEMTRKLKQQFVTLFEDGLGHCTKFKAKLCLREGTKPVFRAKRPVPYAAMTAVDQELDRLERAGVITPVNYSSWATPIVAVKKPNGKVRVCADFSTGLNAALDDHQYPLPIPEDIFAKLNGGKCFAKLDLSDAYLQVEVDESSRELLTINTHRGLYQYNRLPFGVKTAPAIFQQLMDTMLAGVSGAAAYLDDIILMGRTAEELFQRLAEVLVRIQSYGFRIREDKCTFFTPTIKFLGFIFSKDGRRPDPENIRAIQKMPPPVDLQSLRSFCGLISHYSAFLPELHRLRAPLNKLLSKGQTWNWTPECQTVFERVKSLLASDLLLTHFDPSREIVLATDASSLGIGAVVSHTFPDGSQKAIAHAARTLTKAERNYSQIEKEALAIVFAVKKFHKMLYGRRFKLLTDHKPLLAIFGSKKGIPAYTANRLQRWALTLLGYDFEIRYQSTNSLGQADALSRLIDSQQQEHEDTIIASVEIEPDVKFLVNEALHGMPVTADAVRAETLRDPILKKVTHFHRTSWPRSCSSAEMQQFYQRRHSLSIVDDCIMFSDRVVIPQALQQRVLRQFHAGHPGLNRMKALARSYVYWPFMDRQLEQLAKSCGNCATASRAPPKTELRSWPKPTKPWSRVHVDFAGPINGQNFLIVVDAYSKWPEVFLMRSTKTSATVSRLRQIFSRFGCPETLVTDNGAQFTSATFMEFCQRCAIKHLRSPPFHPQSNGQAERFVDTFKRALLKSRREGDLEEVIDRFLFLYRSTQNPQTPGGISPAEAMMKRKLRMPYDAVRPSSESIAGERNLKMERDFNRRFGAKQRSFTPGQPVLVRDYRGGHAKWTPGTIQCKRGSVIYDVLVGTQVWVRHANQLRTTMCQPQAIESAKLPFDLLTDSFNLPTEPVEEPCHQTNNTRPQSTEFESRTLQPRRCTGRRRIPSRRLQVNPRLASYTTATASGGEVSGNQIKT
ncbi:unnamed protein product [Dicrocoelium dendriticum]|nr:unnamed protein product [Dicrocoelium dendriticum]